jgi:hypothetical protein
MLGFRTLMRAALIALVGSFVLGAMTMANAAPETSQQPPVTTDNLLSQFPDPANEPQKSLMAKAVRDILTSNPQTSTLNALLALLTQATPDQASAIGTGLGQAALATVNGNQDFAVAIQTAVAASGNTSALVAFSAVVGGDIKLAAATGGGGAGGGGESGTGSGQPLSSFFNGTPESLHTFADNTADSFTTSTFTPGTPGTPSVSATTP